MAFEFACLVISIIGQHAIGGALCVPSMLGFTGRWVSAAACHGGLCEASWELQDAATRIHQVLFQGEEGKAKNPVPLRVVLFMHHLMGMSMVIPNNVLHH